MHKKYVIPLLAVISILGLLLYGPVPQDLAYHHFADQRTVLNIPNFFNVVTNLPFAFVGIWGFIKVTMVKEGGLRIIGYTLFSGFILVTFGSGYYHHLPNNETLVYDRIPIAIILMSFFVYIIVTHIRVKKRGVLLIGFNLIGLLSVLYWAWTEKQFAGDLRWYGFTLFFPIIAIPLILLMYKSPPVFWKKVVPVFSLFILARLAERFDYKVYGLLGESISGHSLKHLLMAAAGFQIISIFNIPEEKSGGSTGLADDNF